MKTYIRRQQKVHICVNITLKQVKHPTIVTVLVLRCAIPGLDNDTFEIQDEHHARLVTEHIPVTADGSLSSCEIYEVPPNNVDPIYEGYPSNADNKIYEGYTHYPSNKSAIVPCSRWVYDRSVFIDTVITEVR